MATGTWTAADVQKQNAKTGTSRRMPLSQPRKPAKARSKYGAIKTVVDGITFDSKREAVRYVELKILEKTGDVIDLRCQTPFRIEVNGKEIARYYADFTYKERIDRPLEGVPYHYSFVAEDAKGVRTAVYKLKKKLVEAQYGIVIREI
jgi:Protein of unknown function (DUF1064)